MEDIKRGKFYWGKCGLAKFMDKYKKIKMILLLFLLVLLIYSYLYCILFCHYEGIFLKTLLKPQSRNFKRGLLTLRMNKSLLNFF